MRKWESTLRSATKQSRRAFIPRLEEARSSAALAEWIAQATQDGAWVLVCHESTDRRLSELLPVLRELSARTSSASAAQSQPSCPRKIAVIVGPEGGVDPDELSLFEAAGAKICLLGNTVLRASSAGPVALSLISDAIGRW
jgi:RNA methyltransferase, rsmE family